jgi:hypothetical protein
MLEQYISDLFELDVYSEVNPTYENLADWIYTYDIAFPLARLITTGYVDISTLPQKSIDEIIDTWEATKAEGLLG